MTTAADFTQQDWILVKRSPYVVAAIVTNTDFSLISSMKETKAFVSALLDLKYDYANDELVAVVLATPDMVAPDETPARDGAISTMLAELRNVVTLIDEKASAKEAKAFKRMLWRVANIVAEASGEGWFGTGPKVSEKETEVLKRLSVVLSDEGRA